MTIGAGHFAVLSAVVFAIGLGGVMTRRHAVAQLISLAVTLLAPVIALAGFSQTQAANAGGSNTGTGVAAIALLAFSAEIAVGAAILILLIRRNHSLDLDTVERLEG